MKTCDSRMQLTSDDYTIAWIAALPHELAPARALLDEQHECLDGVPGDNNTYTLGRISKHNIVIVGLPKGVIGTTAAASAAKDLLRTFRNIRFGLMVGVGGGVPCGPEDVRLGDIVVSTRTGSLGGVMQYDFGSRIQHDNEKDGLQHDDFINKGFLRDPPTALQTAVTNLEAKGLIDGYDFESIYEKMLTDKPRMKQVFQKPPKDVLYHAHYIHKDGPDCSTCDNSQALERPKRDESTSKVHFGLIGSGNQVIRDAVFRDKLYAKYGILCFEMEAAGLMKDFECMVIRGISDYCDSHKNKAWQPYAAAIAAAFAKEVLMEVPLQQVQAMPSNKLVESIDNSVKTLAAEMKLTTTSNQTREFKKALEWLAAPDTEADYQSLLDRRAPGTGSWIFRLPPYIQWKDGTIQHLWLYGKAGCGKSVISTTIIENVRHFCQGSGDLDCAVFYFTFSDIGKQSYQHCLSSVVSQLIRRESIITMLLEAYRASTTRLSTTEALENIFLAAIRENRRFFLVLDGVDESPDVVDGVGPTIREELYRKIKSLTSKVPQLQILVASRASDDIHAFMGDLQAQSASIDARLVDEDIDKYVAAQIEQHARLNRFSPDTKNKIRDVVVKGADGMFQWVECQLQRLKKIDSTKMQYIDDILSSLPKTLDDTYDRMLMRIQEELRPEALTLLTWLAYSRVPLSVEELVSVTTIEPYSNNGSVDEHNRSSIFDIMNILAGLVQVIAVDESMPLNITTETAGPSILQTQKIAVPYKYAKIRLAHFSIKEYMESERIKSTGASYFHMQNIRGHNLLGLSCLTYLWSYNGNTARTSTQSDLGRFPLLFYAARFWYEHFKLGETHDSESTGKRGAIFLGSPPAITAWLSVYSPYHPWLMPFKKFNFSTEKQVLYRQWTSSYRAQERAPATGLYHAAFLGLTTIVRSICGGGANPNRSGGAPCAPLVAACKNGHTDVVKVLIEARADVNAHYGDECSALSEASENGHEQIVQILIKAGARLNVHYKDGSELRMASLGGHERVVKLLLEAGADPNARCGGEDSALEAASARGYTAIVAILIQFGAQINGEGGTRGCALQRAATGGHQEVLKILLLAGADVNKQDGWYGNALQAAAFQGQQQALKVLIRAGADTSAQGGHYETALRAAVFGGHEKIVKTLLIAGADPNLSGQSNDNPLQRASREGHLNIAKMLIAAGADVNLQEGPFCNSLQAAIDGHREEMVRILIEAGANLDASNEHRIMGFREQHSSALQSAIASELCDIVKLLIEGGANVNAPVEKAWYSNALEHASAKGHVQIVKLLIAGGADIHAPGRRCCNALETALWHGNKKTGRILKAAGATVNTEATIVDCAWHRDPQRFQHTV